MLITPPAMIVIPGTTIISHLVFPNTAFDASAPATLAASDPTGSPDASIYELPPYLIVPAPSIPHTTDAKTPSGGASSDNATPAPIAGPIIYCATCPNIINS